MGGGLSCVLSDLYMEHLKDDIIFIDHHNKKWLHFHNDTAMKWNTSTNGPIKDFHAYYYFGRNAIFSSLQYCHWLSG